MALERQRIEKKDFPIGRRGYDPEAVDAHLRSLADQVEELRRSSRRRSDTLASAASEQVRSIVEAAETSAAEIQRQAEEEAQEIRSEADEEARTTREQAAGQAREYVGRISESTSGMLQRLDAMDSELSALMEALRTGAGRLNADLQLLQGSFTEVRESAAPRAAFRPEPPAPTPPRAAFRPEPVVPTTPPTVPDPGLGASPGAAAAGFEPELEPHSPQELRTERDSEAFEADREIMPPAAPAASPRISAANGEGDGEEDEGARLIALNMALNGTPRAETDRYLAENFELHDRHGLLDEVYASVEG